MRSEDWQHDFSVHISICYQFLARLCFWKLTSSHSIPSKQILFVKLTLLHSHEWRLATWLFCASLSMLLIPNKIMLLEINLQSKAMGARLAEHNFSVKIWIILSISSKRKFIHWSSLHEGYWGGKHFLVWDKIFHVIWRKNYFCKLTSPSRGKGVDKHDFFVQIWTFHSIPSNCFFVKLNPSTTTYTYMKAGDGKITFLCRSDISFNPSKEILIFEVDFTPWGGGWQTSLLCIILDILYIFSKLAVRAAKHVFYSVLVILCYFWQKHFSTLNTIPPPWGVADL